MEILSWNVNGFRASVRKGFYDWLKKRGPDVICMQEVKKNGAPTLPQGLGYHVAWNGGKRKGYSGTGVLTRVKPEGHSTGLGVGKFDREGRVQTLEFGDLILVNVYFPNASRDLSRLDFKLEFDGAFGDFVSGLRGKKPVVICGDFNVAHKETDIARPKDNRGNAGFTDEERGWMTQFLREGWADTFRRKHPDAEGAYTYWTFMHNARERNIGWRLDYVVVPEDFMSRVKEAFILKDVTGSDHAPVGVRL